MQVSSFPNFLNEPVDEVARLLLGCILERVLENGEIARVRIVETEAYDQDDEASHAFGGMRTRNAVMFGPAGHLYVYFTYGMHYCCNVVTGREGHGSGVLIRAVEPIPGGANRDIFAILGENRPKVTGVNLTNGPAKLTKALEIDTTLNGHDLHEPPLKLYAGKLRPEEAIAVSARIGISRAQTLPRRFYIAGNPYVTRHHHGF